MCNNGIAEIQIYRDLFVSIGFFVDCVGGVNLYQYTRIRFVYLSINRTLRGVPTFSNAIAADVFFTTSLANNLHPDPITLLPFDPLVIVTNVAWQTHVMPFKVALSCISHPCDFPLGDDYDINLVDATNKDTYNIGLLKQI